ncbi:MAG: bifunctional phosphoribosyl-AMP cyclohydrolase/phosphoribosyl-ATP diphosphatase, partial [Myxococcota bacterium]|nr:bifunctional phosphoribosyl-AMP cyclohydrolase/phosphoribosyl-ATP diphosphatase [Myxococcota bacterium]
MNVSLAQADGPAELRVAVAQDAASGEVRMVGFASAEAVEATLRSRKATFWSRSRGRLWQKGESSGNELRVVEVWADCDEDAVIYLVDPVGPTCHTGAPSCFHRRLDGGEGEVSRALPSLARLAERLAARREATAATSYTRQLLEAGAS